jgi:hemolysin D
MTARRPSAARPGAVERAFLPAALEIVETPASPTLRASAALIVLLAVAAIAWSWLGRVDIVAAAPGKVIAQSRTKVVQPYETGVVRAIHVADGDRVTKGQVLIELDPTIPEAESGRLADILQQARLDRARLQGLLDAGGGQAAADPFAGVAGSPALVAAARARLEAQAEEQAARLARLDRESAQKRADEAAIEADIAKLDAELPLAEARAGIRAEGLRTAYGNRLDYLQQQQQLVEMRHEREAALRRREAAEAALAELAVERQQAAAEYRRGLLDELAKVEREADEAAHELAKAERQKDLLTLAAPVGGMVQDLAVHTLGGVVTAAQQLLRIVPLEGGIEVEALIANQDAGFVAVGQEAEIKVDAFPFTRYGVLHGHVREIASDAVLEGPGGGPQEGTQSRSDDPAAIRASQRLVYAARIALDRDWLEADGRRVTLAPGMAATAEIKTGRRRVLDYLLSPILRYREEALRER